MNFKLKPLTIALIATSAVLSGCSTEEEDIVKTKLTNTGQVNPVTGVIETAVSGMTCQLPDVVQTISEDFYPLNQDEKDALRMAVDPDGSFDADAIAVWNSNDLSVKNTAYTYDYGAMSLYSVFAGAASTHTNTSGLTAEEAARQVIAKAEAKEFKISQKQDAIFGDDFDTWFDTWFATVPYTDYLGGSQRIARATRGLELALSSANDDQEVCYTPPVDCPNYKMLDESGTYDCIIPEENPIADAPAPQVMPGDNEAVMYFYKADGDYTDITVHVWNNANCTSYDEATVTSWGTGLTAANGTDIDPNYGLAFKLGLLESPDECGNMIVYNKSSGDKFVTQNDAMIALGGTGNTVYHNLDKISYFQEGFPTNFFGGVYLANQHPYFGASASSKSCGWGTELDAGGEACIGQAIDSCPTGTYPVGVGQADIASKCVAEFDVDATDLYVRGGFNDWGTGNQLVNQTGGKFTMHYAYGSHPDGTEEGTDTVSYFFKVADADWSEPSTYGGVKGGDLPSVGGTIAVTAGEGVGQDMSVPFAENSIYLFEFNAIDPANATLSIDKTPVAAFPMLTVDTEDAVEFAYTGNSVYSIAKVALDAGTYSLVVDDTANSFAVGGKTGATDVTVGTALELENGGSALSVVIDSTGEYDVILDLSDTTTPTLLVQPGVPYGTEELYVRGTMTGWGDPAPAEDQMMYDEDSREYAVVYGLEANGTHNFKFASQAWGGALDLGPGSYDLSADAAALTITEGGNFEITPTVSTSYEFSINFDGKLKGELKVQEAPIYIRGGIYGSGDWGADETMRLNFEPSNDTRPDEAGHTYSSIVTTTGTGFFKVADGDWGNAFGFNYGASEDQETAGTNVIELGVAFPTTAGSDSKNISFQQPAGQYRFSFNHVTKELTVTAVD